jgi:lysophospholipase L1-like esterase
VVPKNFAKHPADVVLLHACHNQFADQKPIPSVLADHRAMIASFRKLQPEVIILLAKPIHSGKLPKYAYLPELGDALEVLAKELHTAKQPVILVDHAAGFDWKTDAIADHVHPNEKGGTKMAEAWMKELRVIVKKNND